MLIRHSRLYSVKLRPASKINNCAMHWTIKLSSTKLYALRIVLDGGSGNRVTSRTKTLSLGKFKRLILAQITSCGRRTELWSYYRLQGCMPWVSDFTQRDSRPWVSWSTTRLRWRSERIKRITTVPLILRQSRLWVVTQQAIFAGWPLMSMWPCRLAPALASPLSVNT